MHVNKGIYPSLAGRKYTSKIHLFEGRGWEIFAPLIGQGLFYVLWAPTVFS